jgi:hypothetical protein
MLVVVVGLGRMVALLGRREAMAALVLLTRLRELQLCTPVVVVVVRLMVRRVLVQMAVAMAAV